MFNEWQLSPTPARAPDGEQDRPEVLARLLDEVERDERESRKEAPRPAPAGHLAPRPFAFD